MLKILQTRLKQYVNYKLPDVHFFKAEEPEIKLPTSIGSSKKQESSGPITSWQIDGETVETVSDFILGGSKITADGDSSHEIKRHFLLGRKAMTDLAY